MHTQHHGEIIINTGVDFSGCTAVIGKRYMAETLSLIATNGHTIPGTIAGTTSNGAVYV